MPPGTLSEALDNLYTTTWQNMKGAATENIFDGTPFWMWMRANGRLESVEGGRFLTEPVRYAKSENVAFISKGEAVGLQDKEFLTTTHDDWKYLVDVIVRFMQDDQQNRGRNQIINLVSSKLENAQDSLADKMEETLAGSNSGLPKQWNGLLDIIAEDPTTGTLQGVDASTNVWWRNKFADYDATGTDFGSDGDTFMNNMLNQCSRGLRMLSPDLLIGGQGVWEAYFETTVSQRRVSNKTLGDAGFQNIEFRGVPVVWSPQIAPTDGNAVSASNKGRLYFISSKAMRFKYDPSIFFDMTNWKEIPQQVNDRVAQIVTAGNLMTSRRRSLGVIFDII